MHKDLIAIRFLGGSGGQFLNSFLTAAKFNNKIPLIFGEYGSAHNTFKEFFWHCDPCAPVEGQITQIENVVDAIKRERTSPPYIMHSHGYDLDLLMRYAHKIISVSVTKAELPQIFYAFVGKFALEKTVDEIPYWMLKQNPHTFSQLRADKYDIGHSERCLTIRWHDLLAGDISLLISQLSEFTTIPKENFLEENLINWRKITIDSIPKTMKIFYKYRDEYLSNPNIN